MLYENNIDEKVYPASITKIMTGILMLESDKYNPDGKIAMTKEALDLVLGTGSVVSNLKEGEEITQKDLAHYVLMASSGDTTYLAAIFYGGSVENFVTLMNNKAAELGLTNTHYANPVGLHDEENYTTVRDIYTLTKYALKNETFKEITSTPRYIVSATNMSGERILTTTNYLQNTTTNYYYQYAKGVKTGFTDEAGRCLVSTASYNGYNYMCIVMGCPGKSNRHFADSKALYRWAFNNFSFKEIAKSTEPVCEIPLNLSLDTDHAPLYFKEPFVSILPNEADDSTLVVKYNLNQESVDAPIKKGDVLGKAEIIYAEKTIGTVDLVVGEDVEASWILVFWENVKAFFSSTFMKVFLLIILALIALFFLYILLLNTGKKKKRRIKYIPYDEKENENENND
jgi:D-alanyl-D-alanine carboxypeptidase (penicillin-binding protein 5/6)